MQTLVLPEFGRIQFEGFNRFITQGLIEELTNFPEIEDTERELQFRIFGDKYILTEPFFEERNAVYQSVTYSSDLYVPARLLYGKGGEVRRQTVFLGSIPSMNSQGTFIVNGVARVIVNQILRSPGIYYNSESDRNGVSVYTGTFISNWGGRLKLEIDGKARIWARISKKRKVSVLVLLSAMGLNFEKILASICYPEILLESVGEETGREKARSTEEATVELYRQLYRVGTDITFSESLRRDLQKKFFRHRCELGRTGRSNLNEKFALDIPENETSLLPQDVLAAVDYPIKPKLGIGTIDNIDHLKNRRICSVANLLQNQLKLALNRLEHSIRQIFRGTTKRKRLPTPRALVSSTPLMITFKEFFGSHPLSQFLDQTNPLTEIVHKRRLSSLGPGGLTRRTASFQVRDIHPSHYGRICPIETSEGMNAGLIGSLAIHAGINSSGRLESPFYKISESYKEDRIYNPSAGRDECYRIATGNFLALDQRGREEQITPARYRQDFVAIAWEQVHFRSIFPSQYFSVGASLIPFPEHNDANRALMGSNMQRQAVPLSKPEKCIVGTGVESQTASDSGGTIASIWGGRISFVSSNQITLSLNGKEMNTNPITYQSSNNGTCMHQKPRDDEEVYLKRGQILADGAATTKGELASGKNVSVAYMPWEGYNFEDAILISDRSVYEDTYTSIHIEKYVIEARVTSQGVEKFTREIPHLDNYLLRHLDQNGFATIGSWVETGDILVGKLTPQETKETSRAPEGKLLQAIFGIQITTSEETCLRVPIGGRGRVIDIRSISREDITSDNAEIIHVYVPQQRKIQIGDKIAGRHGNKGIVSQILPRQDMPFLQNGVPMDMILSPLGVPSRMNVGQILECLLGLAGYFLNKNYRITPFDERYEQESSRKLVFSELCRASEMTSNPWLFEPNNPGKNRLLDGRTGEAFEQPVTTGIAYMLKLIHQVDDKIHARSSGPYALVTQQPLRGRSRRGGQRVGEMEVWASEGFGVSYILQEMLTTKSDHIRARYEVLGAIVTGEPVHKPDTVPESFKLLVRELRSLALGIDHNTISEKNLELRVKEI
uniref:DNA-directed RNA polymerase subunit beta n=1 Tax=Aneura pinguis TaxID=39026 RepID=A0A1Z1G5E6_ANEPI|nr:RNA polymerase beta subunit [Aneura pinguis]WGO58389.1 RNA polymerase beta subunit [Aneura pinguis]WGO58475.1 RNA polymerase beta subunit [Aneura pinguis]